MTTEEEFAYKMGILAFLGREAASDLRRYTDDYITQLKQTPPKEVVAEFQAFELAGFRSDPRNTQ